MKVRNLNFNEFERLSFLPALVILNENINDWNLFIDNLIKEDYFIDNKAELIGLYKIEGNSNIEAVVLEFAPGVTLFNSSKKLEYPTNIKWPKDFMSKYRPFYEKINQNKLE